MLCKQRLKVTHCGIRIGGRRLTLCYEHKLLLFKFFVCFLMREGLCQALFLSTSLIQAGREKGFSVSLLGLWS